jgi:hypothetical protein
MAEARAGFVNGALVALAASVGLGARGLPWRQVTAQAYPDPGVCQSRGVVPVSRRHFRRGSARRRRFSFPAPALERHR